MKGVLHTATNTEYLIITRRTTKDVPVPTPRTVTGFQHWRTVNQTVLIVLHNEPCDKLVNNFDFDVCIIMFGNILVYIVVLSSLLLNIKAGIFIPMYMLYLLFK